MDAKGAQALTERLAEAARLRAAAREAAAPASPDDGRDGDAAAGADASVDDEAA